MNTHKKPANRTTVNPRPCDIEACNCGRTHLDHHAVKRNESFLLSAQLGSAFLAIDDEPELTITPDRERRCWMVSLDVGSHHYQYATPVHYSHSPDEVISLLKSHSQGELRVIVNL
jgi:hypothetical protein